MTTEPTKAVNRIVVEGYRSLASVELCPGRLTVLVGPNGSGKSNLLGALRMLKMISSRSLRRWVGEQGGASALLHYGPSTTREIRMRLEFQDEMDGSSYDVRLGYASGDTLVFQDESLGHRALDGTELVAASLGSGHAESLLEDAPSSVSVARKVRWWLQRLNFFHFHDTSSTAPLRQNARSVDDRYLRSNGSNLAAYLLRLKHAAGRDAVAWRLINAHVRRIAPFIKELNPVLVAPERSDSTVRLDWIDERDEVFGVHQLSDGTLRAIALITALSQPEDTLPRFIAIDEPELGLHPAALELVISLMQALSQRCQLLVATQSPAILDLVDPADVVVAERADGVTSLRRLDAHALSSWLEDYTLSELYDKNVLGGRP